MNNAAHNIYIHIPYCMSKCNYCAFFSRACANPDWGKYTATICNEISDWGNRLGKTDVPTVFFGGGTPSLMPTECCEKILTTIRQNFNVADNAEITLESNPGTLNKNKLQQMQDIGINRLSVGVQSLDDERLLFLGRRHTANDALNLLTAAQDFGMRVSADFIYGLPGDDAKYTEKLCNQINTLGLQHCSLYELTIEPGTPFGKMNLNMPDNNEMAQMYVTIENTLNLARYEVSNYAAIGQECAHNQNVWDGQPYVGIGQGAAGRVLHNGIWYEQMGANERYVPMTNNARATEKNITGMRTIRGCKLTDDVKQIIDTEWIMSHTDLVQISNNHIHATTRGMLVLDDIILNMVK